MPEGDTVFRAAARLHRALAGVPLTRAEIRWGERSLPDVIGRQTLEVVARGKHILHRIEGGITVHSHLRMEGTWRVVADDRLRPGELRGHAVRAIFGAAGYIAIGRKLGMLDVVRTAREQALVGHLGPDILGDDWDPEIATATIAADPRPIGEVLLDQRVLAGIGTMYDAETLFLERIPPWSAADGLGEQTIRRVVDRAHRLLMIGKEHDIPTTTGSRRRGEEVYVHARSGLECRRCGTPVRVAMIGRAPQDRTMFYCPSCQGGLAPHDNGEQQTPLGHRRTRKPYR
ncbi:Fpg/Nei family DNA glycosylase [Epidermidibacterium keratini]|uniref:DNA-(apurinic or apyrimidinic site) lyase n=1 Tax=Epidermidibacterium keratini TaxID=1891644 RepID=A0A7L4YMV7_9ACTN|nr:DNA-formamidopyrimidine glycosylase family protein [Epidermidibacterium keratini]QHC00621.1 Fpg/Nei family DNA glycosylase [Epidermidibacterium keratini]